MKCFTVAFATTLALFGVLSTTTASAEQVNVSSGKTVKIRTFKMNDTQKDEKKSDDEFKDDKSNSDTSLANIDTEVESFINKGLKNKYELKNIIVKDNGDIVVILAK